MAAEAGELGATLRVPDPHHRVVRPAGDAAPVGRIRPAPDISLMAAEAGELGAALRVPDPHRPVLRPAGDAAPVGRIRHARDAVFMSAETGQLWILDTRLERAEGT